MLLVKFANWVSLFVVGIAFFYFYTNPSSPLHRGMAEETSKSLYDFTVKVLGFFFFFHICLALLVAEKKRYEKLRLNPI